MVVSLHTHFTFTLIVYILFIEITACLYFSTSVGQHSNFWYDFFVYVSAVFLFPPLGGEIEADRAHAKWKKNLTGRVLPLPRQTGVRFQGEDKTKV